MVLTSFENDGHEKYYLHEGWELNIPKTCTEVGSAAGSSIPAIVPGCVHLDLMRAGLLEDPFLSDAELRVKWVGETEWSWKRKVDLGVLPKPGEGIRRQLVFEGLDTFAEVYIDGELLGKPDNMFHAHRFDLPDNLNGPGHQLEVRFDSALGHVNRLAEQKGPVFDSFGWYRGWARKAGYSYGWDWGPELPSTGIWRPVYLQYWREGRIGWYHPHFEFNRNRGELTLRVNVFAEDAGEFTCTATLNHGKKVIQRDSEKPVSKGWNEFSLKLGIDDPQLWWPAGEGEPTLHPLSLTLAKAGKTLHEVSAHVGLRTIGWIQEKDEIGRSFFVRVNGRDIFAKGANWIPSDNFLPRIDEAKLNRQLDLAVRANMNMIRVWGGGIYEDPAFYRAADERGLMVWQDFMYACALYPDDPDFRKLALTEANEVLTALVRHPSIVLWCGNNEIERDAVEFQERFKTHYMGKSLWHEQLPDIVKQVAPDAEYIPSSPIGGEKANDPEEGDRHIWRIWSGWREGEIYLEEEGRFMSEFGFQAPADPATWRETLAPSELDTTGRVFELHNKQIDGPERIHRFLVGMHKPARDFDDFIRLSQDVQGRSLQIALDHWRRRRPQTMGTLIWQLNDCWPVTSWSLFDSKLRAKSSWHRVGYSFERRRISLLKSGSVGCDLLMINDEQLPWSEGILVRVWGLDGTLHREEVISGAVDGASAEKVATLKTSDWLTDPLSTLLTAEPSSGEDAVTRRAVWMAAPFKHLALKPGKVTVSRDGAEVIVEAQSPLFGLWVYDAKNPDLMITPNALDLMPGDVVRFRAEVVETGKPAEISQPELWWVDKDA